MKYRIVLITSVFIVYISFDALAQVSLRQKIGQMIMVTFTGDSLEKKTASIDTLKTDLEEGLISGVTYFTWSNNLKNPAQITRLSGQLQQRSHIPLFIATDQEGGKVARLSSSNGFTSSLSAYRLGTIINKEDSTRKQAASMAGWLQQSGINIDFAPVADLNVNPQSPAIGALERSFSANTDTVTAHIGWFMDEMNKKNIMTTLKHFPGHGSAKSDSHLGFTDITSTWTEQELVPFQSMINNRSADIVMMGHLYNKLLDSLYPASLSAKVISNLLRDQMKFDGVVITDAMGMAAITQNFGFEESIVLAVNAGVNLLLYTSNFDTVNHSLARTIVGLIERKVLAGIIPPARIDDSYNRVMTLKAKYLGTVLAASDKKKNLPLKPSLTNYPNPFNPETVLRIQLPNAGKVQLKIYDLLGREVGFLKDENLPEGEHQIHWNASSLSSGVYVAVLTTETAVIKQKLMLLR